MSTDNVLVLDRFAPGYPKHEQDPDPGMPIAYLPLVAVLSSEFKWDAHFVAYRVPELARRIGMNNDRLGSKLAIWDRMPATGILMWLFVVDVDAKLSGCSMSDEWWAAERTKVERAFQDQPSYAYTTRGGYRLLWTLPVPFVIRTQIDHAYWKATYLACLDVLRDRYGIIGDRACKDFPRHYRLPRVMRDGDPTLPTMREVGSASGIGPWLIPIELQPIRATMELIASVPDPVWADDIDLNAARDVLRTYVRKQKRMSSAAAARRTNLLERVLEQRALVDSEMMGVAGLGRDNTVFEAANLLGWLCPTISPAGAQAMLLASIVAMDCDSGGGKGRNGYLQKASEVYAASVKKLHQAKVQKLDADRKQWLEIYEATRGAR